jgi:hypothetical protein
MSALWNVSGANAAAVGNNLTDLFTRLVNGVWTAVTLCAAASNPSSGAPTAWGATDVGRPWLDIGVDGTPADPILKLWAQVTGTPTHDFRRLRLKKIKRLDAPVAVTGINAASPAAGSIAWTTASLASLLDGAGVQDTGDVTRKVHAAYLLVRFRSGASETIGTGATETPHLGFRKNGATHEFKVHAQVQGRMVEAVLVVPLDASEVIEYRYEAGGGTPGGTFDVSIVGFEEEI